VAADSQEAGNITPASSTDHIRNGAYALLKKRFRVALNCMAIRTQTELVIRRVQFSRKLGSMRWIPEEYHSEYGNSWFSYYIFRSYNNCYYSSSDPVSDEEDEL